MEPYEEYNQINQVPQYISETESITDLIDVEKELKKFTMEVLRGKVEVINEQGEKEWVDRVPGKKIMNERGVRGFLTLLGGTVTKISKLSNKTEDEIKTDMFYFDMRLTTAMYENVDEWEIELSEVEVLKEACVRLAWDVIASSREGFTAINLKSQYTRNESTRLDSPNQPQPKKIFGIIPTK